MPRSKPAETAKPKESAENKAVPSTPPKATPQDSVRKELPNGLVVFNYV